MRKQLTHGLIAELINRNTKTLAQTQRGKQRISDELRIAQIAHNSKNFHYLNKKRKKIVYNYAKVTTELSQNAKSVDT
jgi:hypothetical protein